MTTQPPEEIDDSVRAAFAAWLRADKWKGNLTRSEAGKLGAAKRELNRVLRRRGLSFDVVAKALV